MLCAKSFSGDGGIFVSLPFCIVFDLSSSDEDINYCEGGGLYVNDMTIFSSLFLGP